MGLNHSKRSFVPGHTYPSKLLLFLPLLLVQFLYSQPDAVSLQEQVRTRIEHLRQFEELQIAGKHVAFTFLLPDFYEQRKFAPAWLNSTTREDLLKQIRDSYGEGLDPEDYHHEALLRYQRVPEDGLDAAELAERDLLFTDAFIRLGYHLVLGKVDPESLDPNWNIRADIRDEDPVDVIEKAIGSNRLFDLIEDLKPRHRFYLRLKDALSRYRSIKERGSWDPVKDGPPIRPGGSDVRVADIRRKLILTGDLPEKTASVSDTYDPLIENAVITFQTRHGLRPDGIVGSATIAALNVPIEQRIGQIRVNLERVRWIAEEAIPRDFLIVNIAGFQVFMFKDQELVWQARAQVGRTYRQTPVFRSQLKYLVFNPTWTVPPGILSNDILPAVRKNIDYLQQKNMQVLDRQGRVVDPMLVDWAKYTGRNFPYIIRQSPGPDNSLGRVKFIFPNKHFVFLHDTPSKALFEREDRTFSSGCIRVENPFELAELLLADQEDWDKDRMDRVVESGRTMTVYLRKELPVLLLYWTAFPLPDGTFNFRDDIYRRDMAVLDRLDSEFKIRSNIIQRFREIR